MVYINVAQSAAVYGLEVLALGLEVLIFMGSKKDIFIAKTLKKTKIRLRAQMNFMFVYAKNF